MWLSINESNAENKTSRYSLFNTMFRLGISQDMKTALQCEEGPFSRIPRGLRNIKIQMITAWIYKYRNTNWKRLQEAICPFNAVQSRSGVLGKVDFWEADERIALTVGMKIPTILIQRRSFNQSYLNMHTEVYDICNLKIFHRPWLVFFSVSVPCNFQWWQTIPKKSVGC